MRKTTIRKVLLAGCASIAITAAANGASAQSVDAVDFDIPSQPLGAALTQFAQQSKVEILFSSQLARDQRAPAIRGEMPPGEALTMLLAQSGLSYRATPTGSFVIEAADPQGGSAGGSEVEALIVTAQKREEDIQDVPIAISAFTQEDLTRSQIAGGPDLMTQIPNFTFTKTNFASYSIQIRGIGTQAISATTDAAVAVAFNNTSMIRNRFFEQEFYDLERVEVLRGPQGTLYGRNATAGVVNIITAKPKFAYEAKASADVANYRSTRIEGMVNIPLVEDTVALRLAGAWTKRNGYVTNEITGSPIDGRDLWSTRVSLRVTPNDRIDVNLIWEHFEEDDDRLRSGKQLCKRDDRTVVSGYNRSRTTGYSALFNQGCLPASLYGPESFQAPDGFSVPYYLPVGAIGLPIVGGLDPYISTIQSRDLRVIESTVDPEYRAQSNIGEFQISIDLTDHLTLTSETTYSADELFSTQDYNRFNTAPGAFRNSTPADAIFYRPGVNNNGVWCDPQIGCANRLVAVDLSTAESQQFSQELRLSSEFDGNFNFSFGGNFLRYDTEDKYYVFINTLSLYSALSPYAWISITAPPYIPGVSTNSECLGSGPRPPNVNELQGLTSCIFIDHNPIGSLNDLGHNYFLSRNPYRLISYAAFGEVYYQVTPELKLTGGLRWTVDKKNAPRIPSWLLSGNNVGYPVVEIVTQEWSEPTGRLAIDWKPDLSFTDDTMVYASYAHGYKAGGANPPPAGVVSYGGNAQANALVEMSVAHPRTFEPEYVDAFEVGSKNTIFDGRVTINAAAFYYDYEGYQISYIVNRSAVNLNFDAKVWGLELEADWRPTDNLRLGFKGGYENTKVADGEMALDVMDRTAGRTDWVVVRPFPSFPSNCIVPLYSLAQGNGFLGVPINVYNLGQPGPCEYAYATGLDPVTTLPYVPNPTMDAFGANPQGQFPGYPGFNPLDPSPGHNNGEGFLKDVGGNELPNAPSFTATITADYTLPLRNEWLLTLHTDLYYQSEAWTRIFNTEGYDKLKAYTNINMAAIFANEDAGWTVMAYVKNVMDRDSITGAFLNSDDSGLTTNVFLTEPRLYGVRVTKAWTGGSLLGSFGERREGPYRVTLELGGQVQRHDAPDETTSPSFINLFPTAINPLGDQGFDLNWGDGREARLTYRLDNGWRVSLGSRSSETGRASRVYREEGGEIGCVDSTPQSCITDPTRGFQAVLWTQSEVLQREDQKVIDFSIGHDFGIGALGPDSTSRFSFGARYARLESEKNVLMYGIPHWDVPPVSILKYDSYAHRYHQTVDSVREFEGVGPMASWEASSKLFGNTETGHVDLDWSIGAGVLFGKQDTTVTGEEKDEYIVRTYSTLVPPVSTQVTPFGRQSSTSVDVPVLDLSLGLSYKVDRMSIGAGYRWERYFDAIDGGIDQPESYDRTIDGPYLKLSVGFGG